MVATADTQGAAGGAAAYQRELLRAERGWWPTVAGLSCRTVHGMIVPDFFQFVQIFYRSRSASIQGTGSLYVDMGQHSL
jgi:hypothetical protein